MDDTIDALEVRRSDLGDTRQVSDSLPDLAEGEVLLRVDRFGLTSNNVTYGVAADLIGYWKFFPAAEHDWGRIPVWGFADVVSSRADDVPVGGRVFGYLPMATHLVVTPTRTSPTGFTDGAAHRAALPAVYNQYRFTTADPIYDPEREDHQAIFVPLFVTSFVLDDFCADNHDFGAQQIILSSASSKTSAGTALCNSRRDGPRPQVVGLTSPRNVDFVENLGCYDEVLTYDDVASLDSSVTTAYVDVAGDAPVRAAVHGHFGDRLAASITVGMTHWDAATPTADLPGPAPQMFFAPSQIEKRMNDWGRDGYQKRLDAAWENLLEVADNWVDFRQISGLEGLRDAYLKMLGGSVDPSEALMINLAT